MPLPLTNAFSSPVLGERVCVHARVLSRVRLFVTPWTVAHQAPLSMEFSRHEYWSGLPFPSPEDLPNPGIKPRSPALQADSLYQLSHKQCLLPNTNCSPYKLSFSPTKRNCVIHSQVNRNFPLYMKFCKLYFFRLNKFIHNIFPSPKQ